MAIQVAGRTGSRNKTQPLPFEKKFLFTRGKDEKWKFAPQRDLPRSIIRAGIKQQS